MIINIFILYEFKHIKEINVYANMWASVYILIFAFFSYFTIISYFVGIALKKLGGVIHKVYQ